MNVIEIKNYKMYYKRCLLNNWIYDTSNYIKIYFINRNHQIIHFKTENIIYEVEANVSIIHKSTQYNPFVKNIIYIVCKNLKNKNIKCDSKSFKKRFYDRIYEPSYVLKLKLQLNPDSFQFKYEPMSDINNKVLI